MPDVIVPLAAIVMAGNGAHALAERPRLTSILLLPTVGMITGPVTGRIDPGARLDDAGPHRRADAPAARRVAVRLGARRHAGQRPPLEAGTRATGLVPSNGDGAADGEGGAASLTSAFVTKSTQT